LIQAFAVIGLTQPFNGFVKFDGYDDALYIPSNEILSENADYTIEFWFKTCNDSNFVQEGLVGTGTDLELNFFTIVDSTQTIVYQRCAMTTNNVYHCNQNHQYPLDDGWHHMAVTYNHYTKHYSHFYDGLYGYFNNDREFDPVFTDTFFIGRSGYQNWLYDHFDGSMDEVRISDVIRYTSPFNPDTIEFTSDINTVALWHMNDTASQDSVYDASGNNHHLSVIQNPHILWPVDSQERATATYGAVKLNPSRVQPYSRCPVPTVGYDIYILYEEEDSVVIEDTVTGISLDDNSMTDQLRIGPNPLTDQLQIFGPNMHFLDFEVLDLNGRILAKGELTAQTNSIPLETIEQGFYLIIIRAEEGSRIFKIQKL
jgi:hypothetical protein